MSNTAPVRSNRLYEITAKDGAVLNVYAEKLSFASSHLEEHQHRGEIAPPGWRCGACRWFEVTIYRLPEDDSETPQDADVPPIGARYMVHTVGRSEVPGEIDFTRAAWADTPHKVMELLTQYHNGVVKLPEASYQALSEAADLDSPLDEALERWLAAGIR